MIQEHLDHLAHLGRRPSSIYQRERILVGLAQRVDLEHATYPDLLEFVTRKSQGAEARCNAVSHLKGFYRWALDHQLVDSDPSTKLARPRRPRRLPRPIPDDELAFAFANAPEPIRVWMFLAAYAGLRCCEIAPLRGEDYAHPVLTIRVQKGGDMATVAVAPLLAEQLVSLPTAGYWFTWNGTTEPITANQLQRHANTWLHEVGITSTMHALRHWYGTNIYRASGRDLRLTQEALRHRSPVSTALYTLIDREEQANVAALLPDLGAENL